MNFSRILHQALPTVALLCGGLVFAAPWAEEAMRGLLVAHGAHHASQIDQLMRGDTKGEAVTWKAMQAHMDTIADALAGAIAKQFPAKAA